MNTPTGLDRNKDVTARVMSEAEAESALGDLLLRLGRPADAQPHLQKAVELDPKLASVQSTMGRYLQEKGDLAGASAFLKRATELDPSNYLTHYYYASLIHRQKTTSESELATLRSELQKTIELAPNFVEATQLLADVNLSRNTDIERTVELLAKALQVAPGNDYMLVQLAFALSRTQQRENARPLTRNLLLKPTLEPRLRQDAQNLLAFLDRAAAADTANRAIAEQRAARNVRTVPAETLQPASAASADETAAPAVQRREVVDPLLAQPVIVETIQPQRPVGTAKIRGLLTLLDCRNGMTISLSVDGKIVKLYTSTPAEIKFTSFNPAVNGTIACGPAPGNGVPAEIVLQPRETIAEIAHPIEEALSCGTWLRCSFSCSRSRFTHNNFLK
jgi:tetratricopeptide (TPR) repeat protein